MSAHMTRMTSPSTRPAGLNTWFRENPGHLFRALPLVFSVFSVVLLAGFVIPVGANMSGTFVTAATAASLAGVLHVGCRYAKATVAAIAPRTDRSEPRGIGLLEIMVMLIIAPLLLTAIAVGINALQG